MPQALKQWHDLGVRKIIVASIFPILVRHREIKMFWLHIVVHSNFLVDRFIQVDTMCRNSPLQI